MYATERRRQSAKLVHHIVFISNGVSITMDNDSAIIFYLLCSHTESHVVLFALLTQPKIIYVLERMYIYIF